MNMNQNAFRKNQFVTRRRIVFTIMMKKIVIEKAFLFSTEKTSQSKTFSCHQSYCKFKLWKTLKMISVDWNEDILAYWPYQTSIVDFMDRKLLEQLMSLLAHITSFVFQLYWNQKPPVTTYDWQIFANPAHGLNLTLIHRLGHFIVSVCQKT